ncbi:hypothetical protein SFRURICE_013922 [Spodoptera frugiperda]|nr:hypothetical protein SFRURICE_013922 [Spodoptera frugiperda]
MVKSGYTLYSIVYRNVTGHNLALVETDSAKLCFLYRTVRAMDGFPTIDTSYNRAAHFSSTATLRRQLYSTSYSHSYIETTHDTDLRDGKATKGALLV